MTSSKPGPRPVPAPVGGQARPASYSRFIPREELAGFSSWTPGSFDGLTLAQAERAAAAAQPVPDVAAEEPPPPSTEEWLGQVADAREQGYQDGYRDGLEALEAAKRQQAMQLTAQVGQMLSAIDAQFQGLEARMAEAVVDTAVRLARQVVRQELRQQPELVRQVAQDALQAMLMSARQLRLRLNPADQAWVREGLGELLQARQVMLLPDPAVATGGCLLESDLGQVDARIETRWQQAAAVFGSRAAWADAAPAAAEPAPTERPGPEETPA